MRQALAEIANVRANAEASASEEVRSSSDAAMAAEVEAELRQMEQAEFERLAAERRFETAGLADVESQQVGQSFDAWDAQYDGLVTVRYSLKGRSGVTWTCRVICAKEGPWWKWRSRWIPRACGPSGVEGGDRGLLREGRIAERQASRFSADAGAPKRQQGTMTYVFVAQ